METYDPRRIEIRADPYSALAQLRARNPVSWSSALRGWLVTRYRDVCDVLRDPRFISNRITPFMEGLPPARRVALSGLERVLTRWTVFADGPAHARLRRALSAAFSQEAITGLQPRVQSAATALLAGARDSGRLDLIADFAAPLPATVTAGLLGLPAPDVQKFAAWSDDLAVFFGGVPAPANTYDRAAYRLAEMEAQFRSVVRARRAAPSRGDVIGKLAAAETEGQGLDEDEIVACLILFLCAGLQTTTDLIGNGLLALLRHPGELARLRAAPESMVSAVEELLRYESPTACVTRLASAATELAGRRIARGDRLYLMIGAANRDPEQFPDPDRLDIARSGSHHLAFGHGLHDCLGAPLARLQAQIAFRMLLERFAKIELAEERVSWRDGFMQRGMTSLKLRVRPQ